MKIEHYNGNEIVLNDNWIIDFDCHYAENFKTGFIDYFIYYDRPDTKHSSCVAYNFPESVPKYVRNFIKSICLQTNKKWNNTLFYNTRTSSYGISDKMKQGRSHHTC